LGSPIAEWTGGTGGKKLRAHEAEPVRPAGDTEGGGGGGVAAFKGRVSENVAQEPV